MVTASYQDLNIVHNKDLPALTLASGHSVAYQQFVSDQALCSAAIVHGVRTHGKHCSAQQSQATRICSQKALHIHTGPPTPHLTPVTVSPVELLSLCGNVLSHSADQAAQQSPLHNIPKTL